MIKYKINIIEALKKKGFNTTKLRNEKLLNETTLTKIRNKETTLTLNSIDKICTMLECDISDILIWQRNE